jgi:hypothetical protein
MEHMLMYVMLERDATKRLIGRNEIDYLAVNVPAEGEGCGASRKTPFVVGRRCGHRGKAGAAEAAWGHQFPCNPR